MIKSILFDLDDTLLGNDTYEFLPRYFSLLKQYGGRYLPEEQFLRMLLLSSEAMSKNIDPHRTNREVFWMRFGELTGINTCALEADLDDFYQHEFETLRAVTVYNPAAAKLMDTCFDLGLKVVIATNPMFPRRAIEARLAWAGVAVDDYPYALVTTIENMHATKPHEAYYREILEEVDCSPQEALMVGDDVKRDIEPAVNLGLYTYWLQTSNAPLPKDVRPTAQGDLSALLDLILDGWLVTLDELLV